jgi:hypothetical protein
MLTAKIDLLMKKLENPDLDHLKMVDARVMCESAEKYATWASTARWSPRISTSLVIPTMVFILIKASMLGGTNTVFRSTIANRMVMGIISVEMSPLLDISPGIR